MYAQFIHDVANNSDKQQRDDDESNEPRRLMSGRLLIDKGISTLWQSLITDIATFTLPE